MDDDLIEMLSSVFHAQVPLSTLQTSQPPQPPLAQLTSPTQPTPTTSPAFTPAVPSGVPLLATPVFSAPNPKQNKDAYAIWTACGLGRSEFEPILEKTLELWAEDVCTIQDSRITWTSATGTRYTWAWPVFLKWFKIACGKPHMYEETLDYQYFV